MRFGRRTKYNATKVVDDGYTFDSKAEHARYLVLKLRLAAGEIRDLWVHTKYHFEINCVKVCAYEADFEFEELQPDGTWKVVSEDVKGFMTAIYKLKAKLFRAYLGRSILETGTKRKSRRAKVKVSVE